MVFLKLAMKSLQNRMFSTVLTVISIALSVALLLTVERAKRSVEQGFTQAVSQTDLIVGARTGPVQLILYSIFNIGNATHNISYETYLELKRHPAISWTIPYSLGDSHKGFRVVGTNEDFFAHYHFRGNESVKLSQGKIFSDVRDVVLGSAVAQKLGYMIGEKIVVTHGVTKGEGVLHHSDKPFVVSGVLQATGTPLDRAVYVSLEGMGALHENQQEQDHQHSHAEHDEHVSLSAILLGAKSKIETLKLQRDINDFKAEPLLAIIPGVTLNELWSGLSYVENVLRIISWMVVLVGLLSMLIALMTTLNERRREMSILRALGATSYQISGLLVFESSLITAVGIFIGSSLSLFLVVLLQPWIAEEFGLYLGGSIITLKEAFILATTFVGGVLVGLLPALRAQRTALKDGLSVKV